MSENIPENSETSRPSPPKRPLWVKLFLATNLLLLAGFVIWVAGPTSHTREEIAGLEKEKAEAVQRALEQNPQNVSEKAGETIDFVIDAEAKDRWAHFRFATGKLFYSEKIARDSLDWDIAFRRAKIVTNGGATNPKGKAGVVAYETDDFDAITSAPEKDYAVDQGTDNITEAKNPFLDHWYNYNYWNHRLTPQKRIYVMRTVDGKYAKFKIMAYYCGKAPACYKIKYLFQPDGSRVFGK